MLKPFIAFTNTDATRMFNSAETKNSVVEFLKKNEFIRQIDDLFLSTNQMRKTFKNEIGYLKLFPASHAALNTCVFEKRLRDTVGVTLDEYLKKLLDKQNVPGKQSVINNVFNTANNKWLLNISWYEKLKSGYFSTYYMENIICPSSEMSNTAVVVSTVSNDHGKHFNLYHQ